MKRIFLCQRKSKASYQLVIFLRMKEEERHVFRKKKIISKMTCSSKIRQDRQSLMATLQLISKLMRIVASSPRFLIRRDQNKKESPSALHIHRTLLHLLCQIFLYRIRDWYLNIQMVHIRMHLNHRKKRRKTVGSRSELKGQTESDSIKRICKPISHNFNSFKLRMK